MIKLNVDLYWCDLCNDTHGTISIVKDNKCICIYEVWSEIITDEDVQDVRDYINEACDKLEIPRFDLSACSVYDWETE